MTNRLYYTEPSRRRFDALVTHALEHEGRPAVTLDQSAFYPSSGGQPFDVGRLGAADVIETVDGGDEVIHVLSSPLSQGSTVVGEIDWGRRVDHMQQHTGQHILSAAFETLFNNSTVGFHMSADQSTIDLAREPSAEEIERSVDLSNSVVWEDRPVTVRFASKDEAASLSLRKEPEREGIIRLIDIAEFDLCACGGTHVDRTGVVGLIAVVGVERMRGGSRLTFVCGRRALRAFRTFRDVVAGSVRALSVLPPEVPSAIERLQEETRDLRKQSKGLQQKLATYEGARLAQAATEVQGARVVVETIEGLDVAGLKALASAATAAGGVCTLLVAPTQPLSIVIACSPGVPIDANVLLQQLIQRFGGRGGGKPGLAQGGGLAASSQEVASAAWALIHSMLSS